MENHPIPQDVTGFQFKLIGNMTIKQFAYILVSGILSVVFFYMPVFILFKLVLIILTAGTGIALAFLPYEGRPLDMMAMYFFKALFAPNQFVYVKVGGRLAFAHIEKQATPSSQTKDPKQQAQDHAAKLATYLQSLPHEERNALDSKELTYIKSIMNAPPLALHPTQQHTMVHEAATPIAVGFSDTPLPKPTADIQIMQKPVIPHPMTVQGASQPIPSLHNAMASSIPTETPHTPHQPTKINKAEGSDEPKTLKHLQQAPQPNKEEDHQALAQAIQTKEAVQHAVEKATANRPVEAIRPSTSNQFVHNISKPKAVSAGLPHVPDVANLIVGIVKDPRGNILPNILVEILDKDGNPKRALKTNMLGQFATATQLENGEYTLLLEDLRGQHAFDKIAITADGKIIEPIEIISHDEREALRQALFN